MMTMSRTIAGCSVDIQAKQDIADLISNRYKEQRGRDYADTHELWSSEPEETPVQTVKRLLASQQGLPGKVTLYQDPATGEVFGYAKYNTW